MQRDATARNRTARKNIVSASKQVSNAAATASVKTAKMANAKKHKKVTWDTNRNSAKVPPPKNREGTDSGSQRFDIDNP